MAANLPVSVVAVHHVPLGPVEGRRFRNIYINTLRSLHYHDTIISKATHYMNIESSCHIHRIAPSSNAKYIILAYKDDSILYNSNINNIHIQIHVYIIFYTVYVMHINRPINYDLNIQRKNSFLS